MQRTRQQNNALHKYFRLLSDTLNEAGLGMKKVLKPEIEIDWTAELVKEYLWRPVMKAQLGKKSTTELTTTEIDKILETITRHLGEKFGIEQDFPSIESIMWREKCQKLE